MKTTVNKQLLRALKKCLACLELDSDMQEDFAHEISLMKNAIKEAT